MGSFRTSLAAVFLLIAVAASAQAQQASCTAGPSAPRGVKAKIDKAIPATDKTPMTPAVLTLTWQASEGGAPANAAAAFVIEAGSQQRTSDVGTTQTAGPELSFTMPMANGAYYVRVRGVNACGLGPPSSDARVTVSGSVAPGQPNPLVVLSTIQATRERLGKSAFVRVMGQVRNGWNAAPAALATVTATYEGAKGGLGVTQTAFVNGTSGRLKRTGLVTDTVLEPGGTGCFVMFAEFNVANVTGLGVVAAPSRVEVEPLAHQVDVDGAPAFAADEFDSLVASGRVKNAGPQATGHNEVWVEARDEAGRVLDCRGTPVDGGPAKQLSPSGAAAFRNVTEAPFSMSRTVRWWITWQPADSGASAAETPMYRMRREALETLLQDPASAAPQDIAGARDALRREAESIERSAGGQ